MAQAKKLYKTVNNKVIAGVAGGLSEYFDVDVVIFRLLFVLLFFFGGGGLLAYIIMWIVLPAKPVPFNYSNSSSATQPGGTGGDTNANTDSDPAAPQATPNATTKKGGTSNTSLVAGIILIVMGVLFLINRMMPWVDLGNFWPILLIIGGFFIIDPNILKSKNRQQ